MTCTTCYRVNPSSSATCYNCGARLTPSPDVGSDADARPLYQADPWAARPTDAPTAASTAREAGYATPRFPDTVYNADGTIALGGTRAPAPASAAGRARKNVGRLLAPLVPLVYLLGKFKFLLLAVTKFKLGITAVTMLVSIGAYAWAFGLTIPAAVGFVLLLFIHEMGHWVVMRVKGVPATAPVFIPFLGAVIGMRGMPRSVRDEAEIGIAGPIAGTAGAFACLGLGQIYGGHLWPLLAVMGLFLNLFNLLPVSPMDGGRVAAAISRWLWPVGLVGLVGLFLYSHNPFLVLVILIGGAETVARFRGRHAPTMRPGYYDITARERLTMGALYFGLIAIIAVAMIASPVISSQ